MPIRYPNQSPCRRHPDDQHLCQVANSYRCALVPPECIQQVELSFSYVDRLGSLTQETQLGAVATSDTVATVLQLVAKHLPGTQQPAHLQLESDGVIADKTVTVEAAGLVQRRHFVVRGLRSEQGETLDGVSGQKAADQSALLHDFGERVYRCVAAKRVYFRVEPSMSKTVTQGVDAPQCVTATSLWQGESHK